MRSIVLLLVAPNDWVPRIADSLFCASETRGQRADTSHMMGGQEWSRRHVHSGESEMSVRVSGMCAPGSRPRHRTVARGGGRAGGAAVSRPQRDGGRASGKAGVGSLAPLAPFGNDRGEGGDEKSPAGGRRILLSLYSGVQTSPIKYSELWTPLNNNDNGGWVSAWVGGHQVGW